MGAASKKHPSGRPTKLTPELQAKLCDAIRAGNYMETAAAFAGIRKATLQNWLRRGARQTQGIYHAFSEAVEKALADSEARDVALIAKAAADGQWQAAAWRLERKFPDRWGRRDRHQVDANIQGTVKVTPDDAIQERAGLLAARAPRGGAAEDPPPDETGGG
jgi:transposase